MQRGPIKIPPKVHTEVYTGLINHVGPIQNISFSLMYTGEIFVLVKIAFERGQFGINCRRFDCNFPNKARAITVSQGTINLKPAQLHMRLLAKGILQVQCPIL